MTIDAATGYFVLPVSIKGVVFDRSGRFLLGFNSRAEWELLGGRPDPDETSPQEVLRREIMEEAGIQVDVEDIVDAWIYQVEKEGSVLIVTYICRVSDDGLVKASAEHTSIQSFNVSDLENINMPDGYKISIRKAAETIGVL